MGFFYETDVFSVIQPAVLKHWREHKTLTPISVLLTSFFLHPPPDSWTKERCSLCIDSSMTVPTSFLNAV